MSARPVLAVALLVLTAGCVATAPGNPDLGYTAPPPAPSNLVVLGAGPLDAATQTVATRLSQAGYRVVATDLARGIVQARRDDAAGVDCGIIRQRTEFGTGEFAGTADKAVFFLKGDSGDLILRQAKVSSAVEVHVSGDAKKKALVAESHSVTLSQSTPTGARVLWRETQAFGAGDTATFADGTICRSSGLAAKSID